jgi:undecaprenyl-diphosphatase
MRDPAVTETNESFPSGHAMGSLVGYGMLAYALFLDIRCRWCRAAILASVAMLVPAIGLSRIYLRAHWLSDVLAGFAIGAAWLSLWLGALEWYRQGRAAR